MQIIGIAGPDGPSVVSDMPQELQKIATRYGSNTVITAEAKTRLLNMGWYGVLVLHDGEVIFTQIRPGVGE